MVREEKSQMVRAGGRTYFFDLKETQEGKKFLILTESRWANDGKEYQRSEILVFPDQAQEFSAATVKMTARLA
ncbi:DUF3276 family protein [Patescibacteria group bacterium]